MIFSFWLVAERSASAAARSAVRCMLLLNQAATRQLFALVLDHLDFKRSDADRF